MNHLAWDFSLCLGDNTIQHISGESLRRHPEHWRVPAPLFTKLADPSEAKERSRQHGTGICGAGTVSQAGANYLSAITHQLACLAFFTS